MSDTSAHLTLPFLAASQAQKHVTHNEALLILDTVVQLSVLDRDRAAPPPDPATGARHIVAAGATGAWAGQDGRLALWTGSAWTFLGPRPGWRAWVQAEAAATVWHDGAWQAPPPPALDNLDGVGVNAAADAVNRLSVSAQATLLSHEGAGHRVKINKAAAGETASLLFQTGWSGRAEMGLAGSDAWSVKVSPDGAGWIEALRLDPASGLASGAAVQSAATDVTAGRLARADYAYGPGNLLGGVAQSGGTPTGAVIERGSTAEGDFVRFADGTQICTAEVPVDIDQSAGALFWSDSLAQDFPAAFAVPPAGSGSVSSTAAAWVNAGAASATQWSFAAFSASARSGDTVSLTAIGRWF